MITTSAFKPAWWLPGPHLQTLWAGLCRPNPKPEYKRERIELADGDFLDLDWLGEGHGPVVILIHGLEGSSQSGYARGLLSQIQKQGWRGVVLHFRGCSGEPNRLAHSYCAGWTQDIDVITNLLHQREPRTPMACVGFSLGGNALLKWLGETRCDGPLAGAVAVSVPFLLDSGAKRMAKGLSRIYQKHLIDKLQQGYRCKFEHRVDAPYPVADINLLDNFYAFDDKITAPLHGYQNVDDYYARASSRQYLKDIQVPTLVLHSKDDPFMLPSAIPEPYELSPAVNLELSECGGHVGFVSGNHPLNSEYWLERRISEWLKPRFNAVLTA